MRRKCQSKDTPDPNTDLQIRRFDASNCLPAIACARLRCPKAWGSSHHGTERPGSREHVREHVRGLSSVRFRPREGPAPSPFRLRSRRTSPFSTESFVLGPAPGQGLTLQRATTRQHKGGPGPPQSQPLEETSAGQMAELLAVRVRPLHPRAVLADGHGARLAAARLRLARPACSGRRTCAPACGTGLRRRRGAGCRVTRSSLGRRGPSPRHPKPLLAQLRRKQARVCTRGDSVWLSRERLEKVHRRVHDCHP